MISLFITLITLFTIPGDTTIYDFDSKSTLEGWYVVDDVVMGGRSNGRLKLNKDGHGEFYGSVSLENNGGFSSVRYNFASIEVKDKQTVRLKVKGDGKTYQFRIKDDLRNYYSYKLDFETNGKWQEIDIPLADMYPTFRGRSLDMPNFNKQTIQEVTFLIANKKNESFKLEIDSITLH